MHILFADDDPFSRLITKRMLERHGHQVTVVDNGYEAVEALEQARYDVLLTDIQMPLMDGCEATREIRRREQIKNRRTPIIALTGLADPEYLAGADLDGLVAKPPDNDFLLATLESVFC